MLNLFLYHLASGDAWFSCGLLFLFLLVLDLTGFLAPRPRLARALRLLLVAALAMAAATATPLALWQVVPLIVACFLYLWFGFANKSRRPRLAWGALAGVAVLTALLLELPYHFTQPPALPRPGRVYVLADSLAAGLGREKMTWPKRLGELTAVEVRDLSSAGATVHTALLQQWPSVEQEGDAQAWVLLCIGGNDMLGRTSAQEFGEELDRLLAAARGGPEHRRTVLMLELPLLPWAGPFGLEQRRVATRHGVVLLPKRLLAGLILNDANVVDGLHLSPAGHEWMAQALARWLGVP